MATSLQVVVALLLSTLVPAASIQLGGVLIRDPDLAGLVESGAKDPAEPVDSGSKDGVLSEEEYRNIYEFDRDLVKEFEAEQPNIDEINVWASDEEEPKKSQAEEEEAPSSGAADADEYMRRKQDFEGLLNDDEWEEKKKEEFADGAEQEAPPEAANGEQEDTKETDPWADAGITHEKPKEQQEDSLPEDAEQKKATAVPAAGHWPPQRTDTACSACSSLSTQCTDLGRDSCDLDDTASWASWDAFDPAFDDPLQCGTSTLELEAASLESRPRRAAAAPGPGVPHCALLWGRRRR